MPQQGKAMSCQRPCFQPEAGKCPSREKPVALCRASLGSLGESARENLPTIGEKNSPEQIPCFVQYHYTKRRVAPPFFLA